MFLKNISLKNFRCHECLSIDFSTEDAVKNPVRKTTFLTGENGTGKSAVLQAIALITGGSEALRAVPGLSSACIRKGCDACEIVATITTAQGEERPLSLTLKRDEPLHETIRRARTTLAPVDAALRHTHRSYFVAGFGAGRRVGPPQGPVIPYGTRYTAVQSLYNKDALLRPLPDWSASLLEQGGAAPMAALATAINTLLPQEVRFHSIRGGQVFFTTPDGLLPLEQLSNGYQQTIAWVGDLLYHISRSFGDYKNPLAARGLLLIDEIDLHLHPAWQRQLYDFLARGLPNFQVVATAYSPVTSQQAQAAEVLELKRAVAPVNLMPASIDAMPALRAAA